VSEDVKGKDVTGALRDEILEDAHRKAKRALDRAKKTAETTEAHAREAAQAMREKVMSEAQRRADWVRQTRLATVESEVKREKLKAQEEMIRNGAKEALARLSKMGSEEVRDALGQLTVEAVGQMSGSAFVVQANAAQHERLTEDFLRETASEIERTLGRKVSLKRGKEIASKEVSGGVVVTGEDGHEMVDNTFEERLKREMGHLRVSLAGILFGQRESRDE